MRLFSRWVLVLALTAPAAFAPRDASASVSIQAAYEPLVKASDAIGVVTPLDSMSQWEDGKIYTYTRVRVDSAVAGDVGTSAETWIRTRGGVVGKVGQTVDGEATFIPQTPTLVFLRHGPGATYEVNARAQGQYPIAKDDKSGRRKLVRNAAVGVLVPSRNAATNAAAAAKVPANASTAPGVTTKSAPLASEVPPIAAADVLHEKNLDDALKLLGADWKRLRAAKTTP